MMFRKLANKVMYKLAFITVNQYKASKDELKKDGYYSQYGQDKFVAELLNMKTNGVFIDIGANDGITFSNSLYFEKKLNWKGLAIEPQESIFLKLEKNRTCHLENCCVADNESEVEFMEIVDGPDMLSGVIDKYDQKHIERIDDTIKASGGTKKIRTVKAFTLQQLCEKYNIENIDYLSIDIEGGELDILKSIDFDKLNINIVGVENNYSDLNFTKFMSSKGYTLICKIVTDEIYKKNK